MTPTFGITFLAVDPPDRFIEMTRVVEGSGFDYLWVADASLYGRYVYAYLTLCAIHTSRVRIGPNCTHPYTRHPAVNFGAMTTIDELAGGRGIMNLGAGGGTLKELGYGVAPVQDVRDMIALGRQLLTSEPVETTVQGLKVKGARLRFLARKELPIYLTASGPRMLELAGELCDGVLFMAGVDPACVRFALERVQEGARRAGRTTYSIEKACCVFGTLGVDRERARETCRPIAAWFVQGQPRYVEVAGIPTAEVQAIKAAFSGSAHGPEAHAAAALVTEEMIDKFTLAGDVSDFIARIEQLLDSGVRHVEFFPEGEDRLGMTRLFGEQIIPRFK